MLRGKEVVCRHGARRGEMPSTSTQHNRGLHMPALSSLTSAIRLPLQSISLAQGPIHGQRSYLAERGRRWPIPASVASRWC